MNGDVLHSVHSAYGRLMIDTDTEKQIVDANRSATQRTTGVSVGCSARLSMQISGTDTNRSTTQRNTGASVGCSAQMSMQISGTRVQKLYESASPESGAVRRTTRQQQETQR